jgi:predicted 3-demethylubiquinone-9 3-methyltransferase (glyoxalase superfamily)
MPTIRPNLWFDRESEEAAAFYCGIFPSSRIVSVTRYGPDAPREEGTVMTVTFELDGTSFVAIDGGPQFPHSEAVSFEIPCRDQAEVDHYWDALTADGGREGRCGWLADRFGVAWQVVPEGWEALMNDPDPARAQRATAAMFGMRKLDIAALRAAADG